MRNLVVRAAAVLAASTLVLGVSEAAQASSDDLSGRWLESQLTHGLVHNDQYKFDDYGLTADTAFALKAVGGQYDTRREIRKALAQHVDSWTTGADYGTSDVYAGSTAKALVVAQTTGGHPRAFGGVDLVTRLNRRVSEARPTVGRIEDKSSTDYANVIGQALAARGLANAGSGKAPEVLRFLLEQQCSSGYFRLGFADKTAADQSCDGGKRSTTSAPDTDVTAFATLSLLALHHQSHAVRVAISDAVRWLKRHQKANGSFGGGPSTAASNSNSTGLAGWALGAAGACSPAAKAAHWVQRLQVNGDVSGTPFAGEKGAIAYDHAAYRAGKADGIGTADRDQWRRATAQAAPALSYLQVSVCRAR